MEYCLGENSEDTLRITPLGAGSEVGRSCIILEYKNKRIMVIYFLHSSLIVVSIQHTQEELLSLILILLSWKL